MKLQAGQIVDERYEIQAHIGTGGMSLVYKAFDTRLDRVVTLKVLQEEFLTDEKLVERFPKEARAAAALNHANIVNIYDHGRDGDILYIVLEFVDGDTLKEHIKKKAPFDDETILGVAIFICEGLEEAHNNNIIHLDIKPQNILVTNNGIIKIADFGIARVVKSVTQSATGSAGSVHYFSPEQARGGYIDCKSDIYSLGIVMYEMVTGKMPFVGDTEVSIALQHINDPLPDILQYNQEVSDSILKIIKKATEKSASMRYQTATEMIHDLKRAITDASGDFVVDNASEDSPTKTLTNISEVRENRVRAVPEEIDKDTARKDFLDSYDDGGDEPEEYVEGEEYGYDDPPPPPPPPPRNRKPRPPKKEPARASIYGGVLFGVVLALIIAIVAFNIHRRLRPDWVEVPDLVGMRLQLAEVEARNLNLELVVQEVYCGAYEYNCGDEYCDGDCIDRIIFQRADPGFMLTRDDPLHVVVSRGLPTEAENAMPLVENYTLADAIRNLEEMGLDLNILHEYIEDENFPARDVVVQQIPPQGVELYRGATVRLIVSAGPDGAFVTVPLLVGLTEEYALSALEAAHLIGNAELRENAFFEAGSIIRQYPGSGEEVPRGTIVTYHVSTGPAPTPTPTPTPTPPDDNNNNNDPQPTPTPIVNQGMFTIHLWSVAEGTEYINLIIMSQVGNEEPQPLFHEPAIHISNFPRPVPITYTEPTRFLIMSVVDDELVFHGEEVFPRTE